MNHEEAMSEQPLERTWQQAIDRLVDGELGHAQSRELLAMLDGIEGGWRRLALTYVEAQWLSRELPLLVHGVTPKGEAAPMEKPDRATTPAVSHRSRLTLMALAVAASMLAAFGLSLWQRGSSTASPVDPATPVVAAQKSADGTTHEMRRPSTAPQVAASPNASPTDSHTGYKDVFAPSAGGQKPATEPRLVVIGSDESARDDAATTVPPRVVEALRRMGHRVDQRSGVMPVRLKDGRSVDIPYDQLDVQYRGDSSYQ